jgi:hypothetical protein
MRGQRRNILSKKGKRMTPTLLEAQLVPTAPTRVPSALTSRHAMAPRRRPGTRAIRRVVAGAAVLVLLATGATGRAFADGTPAVSVGGGVQAGFYSCDTACIYSPGTVASGDKTVNGFALNSIRLYVNGSVTDQIKMTFDTEYTGTGSAPGDDKIGVLDAIARFELNNQVNFWIGRFLPPSDRANLYGPYYANDWAPYADGVADYYPSVFVGRDDGAAYWGQFGIVKVQIGAFDGESLNSAVPHKNELLGAARVMVDFWDPEPGYYLNGTYYGEKDILALGLSGQSQNGKTDASIDGLLEKRLGTGGMEGTVTLEAEYDRDNRLTSLDSSDGWYALVSYLFPQVVGIGKVQPLVKYSDKTYDAYDADPEDDVRSTEVDLNYVIKDFSARVGLYYLHQTGVLAAPLSPYGTASTVSPSEWGVKVQLQM